jgi:ABC-2 type transport system ATP-binding protein
MGANARGNGAAIRCQKLSKSYGEVKALWSLDLTVSPGSIFGFLGRNGAGKTTTIRLLTGLGHPTTGSAWVNGVETTKADSSAREQFGYLPQDPAFYKWMTPVEYLDYVARLFRMDREQRVRRTEEVLQQVGLSPAARRQIGGFSGGMVQRLGIAQALMHQPPVLFLDEPTSSLDPAGRYDVLELIDGLRGLVTVFLSSHILADVERVCDTIGIIHEGRLLLVADRDELLARYATNVIALEFDRSTADLIDAFLSRLQALPWVLSATQENNQVRVAVVDVDLAKKAVLPLVVESGAILNKLEWVRPSLEEIFLKISD